MVVVVVVERARFRDRNSRLEECGEMMAHIAFHPLHLLGFVAISHSVIVGEPPKKDHDASCCHSQHSFSCRRRMSNALHSRGRRSQPTVPNPLGRGRPGQNHRSKSLSKKSSNGTVKRLLCLCGTLALLLVFITLNTSSVYQESRIDTSSATIPLRRRRTHPPPVDHPPRGDPDGTFGGYPVYHRKISQDSLTPYTLLHCLGQNWRRDAWKHRSCQFQFLCFNVTSRAFEVYPSRYDTYLQRWSNQVHLMDLSESLLSNKTFVSIGGINLKWGKEGIQRLKWFPTVKDTPPTEFYALPPQVVLIPYHSLGGWNPGHAVWDDFLPLWSLADLFQLPSDNMLALRYILEGDGLWASCDAQARTEECQIIQQKFWPLFSNRTLPATQQDVRLEMVVGDSSPKTDLVCAKNGLAGIGDLTDHGFQKLHGWHDEDYQITYNHGRGGRLWKFRSFCLNNLGIPTDRPRSETFRVVFSIQSSNNPNRNLDFMEHRRLLAQEFTGDNVEVKTVVLKRMSLREQIQMAAETDVFITGCGGGAVTATFLPKGATAIIYFNEQGGQKQNKPTGLPARLDWDLFNHLSYIRVLWFPSMTMYREHDLETFVEVVKDAMNGQRLRSSNR